MKLAAFIVLAMLMQTKVEHYVFTNFERGVIKYKTGNPLTAMINYNTLTEEMVFKKGDAYMAMTETAKIDTVFVAGHKFVPEGETFKEVLQVKDKTLYIRYHSTAVAVVAKAAGAGAISQNASQLSTKSSKGIAGVYNMNIPEEFKITSANECYIKTGKGIYQRITNTKSLEVIYPGRGDDIRKYVKSNHLELNKVADLTQLIEYLG
ncbi:hypothetical protein [Hufsiella ginkgonis]|uniref:Uncharacterized protein n=1 Tax=Hufsiella ginkgonis TaxID=2695274 RepID=A0A7K1XYI3_9SPHI|nr:hypothetical protein [Hufsiella ginkgonis]MXV16012.1 hypothetical protein [Hufsiella ginkgonis]